jgi:microcystin-dependent protein
MGTPFMGEVKIISWNYAPKGWAFCNGQFLPINQNQALFSLLGTRYGGNGQTTFALPDLRGRVPIHMGNGHTEGEAAGQEAHTLTQSEMPAHIHFANATSDAHVVNPENYSPVAAGNLFAIVNGQYGVVNNLTTLIPGTLTNFGGSQPHENRQPYLVLNFVIALIGVFPSQN